VSRGKPPRARREPAKIQFLALGTTRREDQWDLARLRTLTEIRGGSFPWSKENAAPRHQLEAGEIAHYDSCGTADRPTTPAATASVKWDSQYSTLGQ
jgi:hypothetical protein